MRGHADASLAFVMGDEQNRWQFFTKNNKYVQEKEIQNNS